MSISNETATRVYRHYSSDSAAPHVFDLGEFTTHVKGLSRPESANAWKIMTASEPAPFTRWDICALMFAHVDIEVQHELMYDYFGKHGLIETDKLYTMLSASYSCVSNIARKNKRAKSRPRPGSPQATHLSDSLRRDESLDLSLGRTESGREEEIAVMQDTIIEEFMITGDHEDPCPVLNKEGFCRMLASPSFSFIAQAFPNVLLANNSALPPFPERPTKTIEQLPSDAWIIPTAITIGAVSIMLMHLIRR
eukprot:NODE_6007_length_888_cov_88.958170_g5778_i0.p1 GENE.NODE_6007_length_888_cov_88.958170_g5778_i0~~NODE_6007_length_888_cov_88.958170_g5778_i0.p1  ORF type:complete len:268 (-),score=24.38 NODE_6007_length_888_cov_88.958170_g5778_i0:85-837(-)